MPSNARVLKRMQDCMRRIGSFQFSRFSLVGASVACIYVAAASSFRSLMALPEWWASILACLLCIPVAYMAQRRIAFRSNRAHATALPRYVATQALNLVVAAAASGALGRIGYLPPLVVFSLAGAVAVIASYVLLSRWAFSP
jgi:putative flippase GtrA